MSFPSPGDLPDPGTERGSPALQEDSLPARVPGQLPTVSISAWRLAGLSRLRLSCSPSAGPSCLAWRRHLGPQPRHAPGEAATLPSGQATEQSQATRLGITLGNSHLLGTSEVVFEHIHEQFRTALPGWWGVRVATTGLSLDCPWRQNLMKEETSQVVSTYSRLKLLNQTSSATSSISENKV